MTALLAKGIVLAVAIFSQNCPAYPAGDVLGCAYTESRIIYVNPGLSAKDTAAVLAHEVGHLVDRWRLTDVERQNIERAQGWQSWWPERFAWRYSACVIRRMKCQVIADAMAT